MRITVSTAALASLISLALLGAGSVHASVPVDVRVATNDGGNLADVIQYVPNTTTIKTYNGPDCFSAANQSSGQSYKQSSPNMLGAIWEAAQVEPALQPVRVSDANFADFGSLGVCQINAGTPPGFFFLKANHQALQVGADQFPIQGGESLLAYRTPDDFTADEELDLTAPVRTAPGLPVIVNVRAYTTTVASRPGATVLGAGSPVQTDVNGNATVSFPAPGTYQLTAAGDYNDIPSPTLSVCVAVQPDRDCPAERGREILGSDEAEGIKGTDGDDLIRPRGGNDGVKAGGGNDQIIANGGGRDRIFCGGGTDIVVRDAKDRVSKSCEKVRTSGKKKHHKGKGKK